MEKNYSLYLDSVRFLAALLVVMAHYVQHNIINDDISYYVPELGREAVMIFFVLSGYVIAFVVDIKKSTLSEYFIARASRIYSVALPLLILAFASVFTYSQFYSYDVFSYQIIQAYIYIPFHSFFLGEIWTISEKPPWLSAYWSLNYEVWYYVFFASIYYFSGIKRLVLAGIIFIFLGFKLWLLLPVWLSGVLLYKYNKKYEINKVMARIGWLFSIIALCFFKYFDIDIFLRNLGNEIWPFSSLHLGGADRYLSDYLVCIIIIANFYFAIFSKFSMLMNFEKIIKALATYTFTLYLTHSLVMSAWAVLYNHNSKSIIDVIFLTATIGLSTYVLGMLTEHKKYLFTRFFKIVYKKTFGVFNLDIKNPNT